MPWGITLALKNELKELDNVVLLVDKPEYGLKAGDVGIILGEPIVGYGPGECFDVEFETLTGRVIAVLRLGRDEIRPTRPNEIATVRTHERG